eukprot:scaffold94875_cov66-Phaeocystis_antarctica.AAC.3
MAGVPASLTTATRRPWRAYSTSLGTERSRLLSLCVTSGSSFRSMPSLRSRGDVTFGSSVAMTSASRSVRIARSVMSSRLPIGVLTKCTAPRCSGLSNKAACGGSTSSAAPSL